MSRANETMAQILSNQALIMQALRTLLLDSANPNGAGHVRSLLTQRISDIERVLGQ